ncbi:hypothetical protein V6Z11_1Z077700 [Gossypium hirsutum]
MEGFTHGYDENDSQSHNRHLAGEGNNKFPPFFLALKVVKIISGLKIFLVGVLGIAFSSSAAESSCDEPGCLINQMEPTLKHGDGGLSKVGDDLQPALQSGEFPGNFLGSFCDQSVDDREQEDNVLVKLMLIHSVQNTYASNALIDSQDTTHLKHDLIDENVDENSALDVHSKEDGHAIGNITTAGEPVDRISKGNSNLQCISEDIVLSERKLHDIPMPFLVILTLKEHGSEVSNMDTRNSMSLESNMDSTVQIACDALEKKDSLDKSIVVEHSDDYKSDQTVSTAANQNTKLSSDSSNTDCGEGGSVPVIKGVDFSSSGTGGTADDGKSMECVLSPSGRIFPAATAAVSDQNKAIHGLSVEGVRDKHVSSIVSDSTVRGTDGAEAQVISKSGSSEAAGAVSIQQNNQTSTSSSPSTSKEPTCGHAKTDNSSFPSAPSSESQTKIHMMGSGSSSADLDNPSCGSPIVIRTSEQFPKNKDQSISEDMKRNYASPGDRTFTFEVPPLADLSGNTITASLSKVGTKAAQEVSHANLQASESENVRGRSKGTSEGSGSKGTSERRARARNCCKRNDSRKSIKKSASLSSAGIGQLVQSNEVKHSGHMEGATTKPFVFHQPFTDLQQVQLRAQIFVYGALIQGTAPDEAYMISAFGGLDGGRTMWENAWRACIDRVHSQKSHLVSPETPMQTPLGAKSSDQSVKRNALQNKVTSSPVSRISTPSCDALQSTGIPRSAVMDYQQALSPLRPPPIRNFVGHNAPWMSQSPFRVPWVPQTSSFDARFPVLPITETVNLTPAREASVPHSSAMKQASTVPMVQSGCPANVFAGTPLLDTKKATATRGQHSAYPKPRKRKKSTVSEDPGQIKPHSQSESPAITTLATVVSKSSTDKFVTSVPVDHLENGEQDSDQRVALSEETFGKLQEAQKQAEDASALAAAAVHHSQEIWNQLGKHKKFCSSCFCCKGCSCSCQGCLKCCITSKLMADEALVSTWQATPASILRGENATSSSNSIIIAAREAARRRVEAASAASKRAENMDAIVKAAELAAEAVSQAGKIVAMGEPFPLTELVEAVLRHTGKEHIDSGRVEGPTSSARLPKEVQVEKREKQSVEYGMSPTLREIARESIEDHSRLTGGILGPTAASGKDKKGPKGRKASEIAKTKGVTSESEIGFGPPSVITQSEHGKGGETSKNNNLREGSRVEVLRDGDGLKVAWFPADILDLKDGKAYVCYNELRSEDGDKLKEWVELEGEGNRAPRIRTVRPVTAMPFEGTRKRRRAAMGDYNWAPGDRVDSWMQDSWWEGVVTEKSQTDETSFTVHFPARGETSVVKAWLLRPSLIWKNGSWVEGSSFQDNNGSSHEGDTPQEKRPRIGGPVVEGRGEDKLSKSLDLKESWKPGDMRLLDLSDNEKIFNIGRSTRDENKPDSLKMVRTGLKKEGSRVIFGVPKPGKKRKFMEVSKHYVADQSGKTHEISDSAKFSKYLMPQGSEPREMKNKIEPKDKRAAVYRPKVLKSGKPPSVSSRTIHKDSLSNTLVSEPGDSAAADIISSSDGAAKGPVLFSSVAFSSDAPPKKNSASNAKSERVSKPKLGPASGKLAKIEEEKGSNDNSMKTVSEVEPRRSNRRIQPTSRLLEGLQSSLIISKIPSVSHDRSHKSQNRSSRGNNQG